MKLEPLLCPCCGAPYRGYGKCDYCGVTSMMANQVRFEQPKYAVICSTAVTDIPDYRFNIRIFPDAIISSEDFK